MKKSALIIGASGDIGKATATKLLERGFHTYLHFNNDKNAINQLLKQYGEEQITPIQADLSRESSVQIIKNSVFNFIDILIYNAGATYYGLMTDIDEQTKQTMIQLNITSLYSTVQEFLPAMIRKRNGNIVVISSIWGQVGASCEVLYSMTKGAQIAFVKALAKETALNGVHVNAVAPGAVNTKMLATFSEEEKLEICSDIPMGRFAQPEEIADAVLFLISDKASYMTGQVLGVNGGWN